MSAISNGKRIVQIIKLFTRKKDFTIAYLKFIVGLILRKELKIAKMDLDRVE